MYMMKKKGIKKFLSVNFVSGRDPALLTWF
jgi:hypothetical protein